MTDDKREAELLAGQITAYWYVRGRKDVEAWVEQSTVSDGQKKSRTMWVVRSNIAKVCG